MSEPRYSKTNQLDHAIHELISARSALNMYPDPIPGDPNRYISESDGWVKHAMEHLDMVSRMLIELQTQVGRSLGLIALQESYSKGYEDGYMEGKANAEKI